jgi:UrcA family protein
MKNAQRRLYAIALACLSLAVLAPAASARPLEREVRVEIFHGDLDLLTEAGARTAYHRIRLAARRVCGQRPTGFFIQSDRAWRACRDSFTARAVEAFNAPTLTALYFDKLTPPYPSTKRRA